MTVIEATELEQRLLAEAADCGWGFSLEQLRESRRRGPDGLLVAQRLLEARAADSLSAAEELALVDECWRAGGVWLLEELVKDRRRASRALIDVWTEANEPAGEVVAGPARLVRVALSHVLSVSGDPVVDEETGFTIECVGLDICHDRLFEAPPGWVPPIGTNPGLRVSYDPAEGFGFWADERLECAWCVSDWMVDDGYELRSVDRSVFEGVIQRHGHRLGKDDWLESVAFCLLPVQETSSQEAGGESFFHGSMRFKPGEGFMRAADDVLRPESQ